MRWAWWLLLASCGDNVPADPFALRDGSRLELRAWRFSDGTRQVDVTTYFDADLAVECTMQRWSDGHLYCTPAASQVAFADAGCTSPVGQVFDGSEAPGTFRRDFALGGKSLPSKLYRRGEPRAPLAEVWRFDGTACTGPFVGVGAQYFDVAPLEAARVRASEPRGDGRIRAEMLESDDGMQTFAGFRDSVTNAPCRPTTLRDGRVQCLPTTSLEALVFRDPACTQRLVSLSTLAQPAAVRLDDATDCDAYFALGAEVSKYPLYAQFPTSGCTEITLPDSERVFEIGARIAPILGRVERGDARLRLVELTDGTMHAPAAELFDAELATACHPDALGGATRCVPAIETAYARRYFATDRCESTTYATAVWKQHCGSARRFAFDPVAGRLHEIGAPAGPVYEKLSPTACVPVAPASDYEQRIAIPYANEAFAEATRE